MFAYVAEYNTRSVKSWKQLENLLEILDNHICEINKNQSSTNSNWHCKSRRHYQIKYDLEPNELKYLLKTTLKVTYSVKNSQILSKLWEIKN